MDYDVFICHASEDKGFVEPLAQSLIAKRLKVWYDRFELKIGDSLRQEIDRGLASSRYGIVVLSKSFFMKGWAQAELDALASRQNAEGRKVILPIWHEIDAAEVLSRSPLLGGLLAARSSDGLNSVVGQILNVCSEPDESQPTTVFQTAGKPTLREKCLEVIRQGDILAWRKLVDEVQAPIDQQLIAWKKDGETAIQQGQKAWRDAAVEICLPGFVPLWAAVETGKKEHWNDAVGILRRLALLRDKMGAGITDVLDIGWSMLYVPGNIGMAIAADTRQLDLVWDWMLMPMPGYQSGQEIQWAEIRQAFWPPVDEKPKEAFGFLLNLYDSEQIRGLFTSKERMKECLFKTNLLQSIVELKLLCTGTVKGAPMVEQGDSHCWSGAMGMPLWCLIKYDDFRTWTSDLFRSSDGFIKFFKGRDEEEIRRAKIWSWWKGWKKICAATINQVTQGQALVFHESFRLPGEPE